MALDVISYALSKGFTSDSLLGGGTVVGKNVTISSITPIEGGNKVTFSYTLDDGTVKTSTMDVMNGIDGKAPSITIEANDNWFVDGIDTGIKAKGEKGDTGSGFNTTRQYSSVSDMMSDTNPANDSEIVVVVLGDVGNFYMRLSSYIDPDGITNGYLPIGSAQDISAIKGDPGKDGKDGLTPHIDSATKHWFLGTTDTGVKAEGVDGTDGEDGVTPHIDSVTKHWFIGDTDTGIVAEGGSGSSEKITVDSDMSDTSENPVQNKVVKKYVDDKSVDVSAEVDNAIEKKDDGLYVENKTEEINSINEKLNKIKKYQKYVNTELDSCFCKVLSPYTPVEGEVVPFISVSGNMENTEGKIKLNPGKRVQVIGNINYYNQSSNSNANIIYALKDITNNIEICIYQPYSSPSDTNNEFSYSFAAQYENSTNSDCEIGLVVKNVYASDTVFTTSNMTIQEINRAITINPIEYVNSTQGIEDTPVGHIIAHMGNSAPTHYLICDGTEYNIADYPYLAQHFIDEFGSVNYFGGDGTTTFAVPDLRGEFLRGTGINPRVNQGSGANVGEHQDATSMPNLFVWSGTFQYLFDEDGGQGRNAIQEADTMYGTRKSSRYTNVGHLDDGDYPNSLKYTIRPTNTSVLYCIKAFPTYFMNVSQSYAGFSTVELFNGSAKSVQLDSSIMDYSYIDVRINFGGTSSPTSIDGKGIIKIPIDNNIFLSRYSTVTARLDVLTYVFSAIISLNTDYLLNLDAIGFVNNSVYNDRLADNAYSIDKIIAYKSVEV